MCGKLGDPEKQAGPAYEKMWGEKGQGGGGPGREEAGHLIPCLVFLEILRESAFSSTIPSKVGGKWEGALMHCFAPFS